MNICVPWWRQEGSGRQPEQASPSSLEALAEQLESAISETADLTQSLLMPAAAGCSLQAL